MKKLIAWGWLALFAAGPVMADGDEASAEDAAPVEVTAEPAAADAAPVEEAAAAEAVAPVEAPAEEAAPAEETASDEGGNLNLYVGVDYDMTTVDLNDSATETALGGRHRFDSDFYKLRLGVRLFEVVGVEFHAGFPANDSSTRKLETKQFYALYLAPTGVLFELIEVSARVGYAYTELKNAFGKEDLDGASFGLAVELPLRRFGENLPNLRIGAGGTVYQEDRDARVYGFHGGLRYDFTL